MKKSIYLSVSEIYVNSVTGKSENKIFSDLLGKSNHIKSAVYPKKKIT